MSKYEQEIVSARSVVGGNAAHFTVGEILERREKEEWLILNLTFSDQDSCYYILFVKPDEEPVREEKPQAMRMK